jgi:RHS repeat-associated protein
MPDRSYNSTAIRYSFNGKEDEIFADRQDYGFRNYDKKQRRFTSVDPLTAKYPELTPFQFASNCPISGVDLDGLEYFYSSDGKFLGKWGKSEKVFVVKSSEVKKVSEAFASNDIYKFAGIKAKELSMAHNQLLDRANWIYAEGGGYYAYIFAQAISELRKSKKSEEGIFDGMVDVVRDDKGEIVKGKNGKPLTKRLDKDKYLKGELHNPGGKKFYENREKPDKRSNAEWLCIEAVIQIESGEYPLVPLEINSWVAVNKEENTYGALKCKILHYNVRFAKYGAGQINPVSIPDKYKYRQSINLIDSEPDAPKYNNAPYEQNDFTQEKKD